MADLGLAHPEALGELVLVGVAASRNISSLDRGHHVCRQLGTRNRLAPQAASALSLVVGGVLLTGGFGSVVGIFFGTITFAIVNQGIYYTDFDRNWSALIIGVPLLRAVLMNNTFRKMALSYSPKKK